MLLIIIILTFICIICIIKLYLVRLSIKEIKQSLKYILTSDTNNIIAISSSDKNIKDLAINLNKDLLELRKQKLQYQNGNKKLKEIITNIAHDLRTPLTSLNGYIDLMEKEELSENQKQYLNVSKKKIKELTILTKQLFEFSKIIDLDTELQKEECCINEILEEVLVSFYNIFKEQNIIPTVSICEKKINKNVNKISLIRIFENILSNVSQYSVGDFKVNMNENGIITFSNKAKFLDATTVQKMFDRYFSVENAKESNGIGLSIAKQLVELNDGEIWAKYVKDTLFIEIYFK